MNIDPDRFLLLRSIELMPEWTLKQARKLWAESHDVMGLPENPIAGEETILAGLHKARILAGDTFSQELRDLSKAWLREHDYEIPEV
jgi:hypothetical protein